MPTPPIRPIYAKSVAIPFVIVFGFVMLLLGVWYMVPYPQPDPAQFQWYGSAYLMAYAVAEMVRRASWSNFLLLAGVGAMLLADIARHFTFFFGSIFYAPGSCNAGGIDDFPCTWGMPLVERYHQIVLVMAALFTVKLAADLVFRLRRRKA